MTTQPYRVVSYQELPLISHADFSRPMATFTLVRVEDEKVVRVSLPRRTQWKVGEVIQIDDAIISANLTE